MIFDRISTFKHRRALVGLLLVAALTAAVVTVLLRQTPAPHQPLKAVPVTLVRVERQDVPNYLMGVGTVKARASVTVKAQIDGELQSVKFVEGEDVKAGQVLAQLDTRTLHAQLEQAQAQKARDLAQLANAHQDLDRTSQLIRIGGASQQDIENQHAQVAELEAAAQSDAAQIDYARTRLDYATITAPMSGRVGARLVDPGNIVHATDADGLVVINQIDPIDVVFTLPGDAVQAINRARRNGQPLPVLVYARDGNTELAHGALVLVNNQIDESSGTIQLKARFANPQHVLWPGQYVNVRLQLSVYRQALTVPAAAVQRGQAGTYVYAVDANSKADIRAIEVRQIQDATAVIAQGLHAGEVVVLDGQYKLKPGAEVVAAPTGQATAEEGNR